MFRDLLIHTSMLFVNLPGSNIQPLIVINVKWVCNLHSISWLRTVHEIYIQNVIFKDSQAYHSVTSPFTVMLKDAPVNRLIGARCGQLTILYTQPSVALKLFCLIPSSYTKLLKKL